MKRIAGGVFCGVMVAALSASAGEIFKAGKIVQLQPGLSEVLAKDAPIEQLGEGYEWAEGPAWQKEHGFLVFSDIPNNRVMSYQPGDEVRVFLQPAGYDGKGPYSAEPGSNGLAFDKLGQLVLMQHGNRRVACLKKGGTSSAWPSAYQGKRFNSPNDCVFKSNGDLYFTDPPYGLPKQADDPSRELDFCGVYRLTPDGTVTLLTDEMTRPNGIGFSPDEKTLYVANSDPEKAIWMAYDVASDGTIENGRVFADVTDSVGKQKGLPDGLKVAQSGHLFATALRGVRIFAPDGKHLGTIETGEATANCAFGEDGTILYITADMYLLRVPTKTKGIGF